MASKNKLAVTPTELTAVGGRLTDFGQTVETPAADAGVVGVALPGSQIEGAMPSLQHSVKEACMTVGGRLKEIGEMLTNSANNYVDCETEAAFQLRSIGSLNAPPPSHHG